MVQVKADAASSQADAVVLRGRGGLEKYLVYANGLVFWDEENVLELDRGDVCNIMNVLNVINNNICDMYFTCLIGYGD